MLRAAPAWARPGTRGRCADAAAPPPCRWRQPMRPARRPAFLPRRSCHWPRGVVDCILEHARDRAVVFGRDEQEPSRRRDLSLQPLDGLGRARVIVLVVERQVVYPDLLKQELRRRKSRDRGRQLATACSLRPGMPQRRIRLRANTAPVPWAPAKRRRAMSSSLEWRRHYPPRKSHAIEAKHPATLCAGRAARSRESRAS